MEKHALKHCSCKTQDKHFQKNSGSEIIDKHCLLFVGQELCKPISYYMTSLKMHDKLQVVDEIIYLGSANSNKNDVRFRISVVISCDYQYTSFVQRNYCSTGCLYFLCCFMEGKHGQCQKTAVGVFGRK